MQVEVESFNESISESIRDRLTRDVTSALKSVKTVGDEFVVNDTLWFWRNPAGAIRPTVVNAAGYISKQFQNHLQQLGWQKEPTINGQNFDALLAFQDSVKCYSLLESDFLTVLQRMREAGFEDYGLEATAIFRQFVQSSTPFLPSSLVPFSESFTSEVRSYDFRIGLEFETGNIASSFRAIDKLQGLYDSDEIDIGIFVTSKSKRDGAARIWPVSNRNGSFEELRQRNYQDRRRYPHIDISFRPDRYDANAKYFGDDGLYEMKFTGEVEDVGGIQYDVALSSKQERKLRPKNTPKLL